VLVAVVAGAVVVSRQVRDDAPTVVRVDAPGSHLPVAAEPNPVSSTWYCAGGTAVGEIGPAELSVVIANAAPKGARAQLTLVGPKQRKVLSVDVPANDRTVVHGNEALPGDWLAMTVEVFGGRATVERVVKGVDGFDVSPCSSTAARTWYVPSGSTLRGATERLVLYNPFPADTSDDIRFVTDEGRLVPSATQGILVAAHSMRVVTIENPARRKQVAAVLTTRSGLVVVDRIQRYDGTGDPLTGTGADPVTTDPPRGLVSTPGLPALAGRWFFPDAQLVEGGRLEVWIHNPGRTATDVDLVVGYEDPSRYPEPEPLTANVRAGGLTVVDLTGRPDLISGAPFSVDVRAVDGHRVAAELVWITPEAAASEEAPPDGEAPPEGEAPPDGETAPADDGEAAAPEPGVFTFAPGVAVSPGSPIAATEWFVGAGATTNERVGRVTVANPGAAKVTVTLEQLVDGRRRAVPGGKVTIAAGDRRSLDLSGVEPGAPLLVRADRPVVVARLLAAIEGQGLSLSLATPFPDTVTELPNPR
jgi:hypothetical protein